MNHIRLVSALTLLPMTAAAQVRDAASLLRGPVQALGQAGFAGMKDISVSEPPSALSASPAAAPADETSQAVKALVEAALKSGGDRTSFGAILRKVGLVFNGEIVPVKDLQVAETDLVRLFSVTSVRGTNDIFIETVKKVGGKKKLRSYLISPDGKLLGSAVSWKENGAYLTDSIPAAEAEADYREQLDFWMRYYRANLKKP
ncbi:MAG: hypothetical protein HY923_10200 [Elusimicrobia bacterium]|nr:hypothetical protein [Elusimicrobiota bacterium]